MLIKHQFDSLSNACTALADSIINDLTVAIQKKGEATIAVSGGSTPIPLFKALSNCDLDWQKVMITLVDDRWVDENDAASNELLVKTYLLQNRATNAHFIGLKMAGDSPFTAEQEINKRLTQSVTFPLDVIVLGMGDDGHTASLFPNAANLSKGLDFNSGMFAIGMMPLNAPHDRITLTLPVIMKSKNIYLHLSGDNKLSVLKNAESGTDVNDMPIRAVINDPERQIKCYWSK